jgi:hypothetical protein
VLLQVSWEGIDGLRQVWQRVWWDRFFFGVAGLMDGDKIRKFCGDDT